MPEVLRGAIESDLLAALPVDDLLIDPVLAIADRLRG